MDIDSLDARLAKLEVTVSRMGGATAPGGSSEWKAEDWDFKVQRVEEYPGPGWIFTQVMPAEHMTVYIVWRMSRVYQAERGIAAHVPLTAGDKQK